MPCCARSLRLIGLASARAVALPTGLFGHALLVGADWSGCALSICRICDMRLCRYACSGQRVTGKHRPARYPRGQCASGCHRDDLL